MSRALRRTVSRETVEAKSRDSAAERATSATIAVGVVAAGVAGVAGVAGDKARPQGSRTREPPTKTARSFSGDLPPKPTTW